MLDTERNPLDLQHVIKAPSEYYQNHRRHSEIIAAAMENEQFSQALFFGDKILALGLSDDNLMALLLACASHRSSYITENLLDSKELTEFSKRKGIFQEFVGLTLSPERERSYSAPSSARNSLLPDEAALVRRTASAPTTPTSRCKDLAERLQVLRRSIIPCIELVYRRDEQASTLLQLFNFLWRPKIDDYQEATDKLHELMKTCQVETLEDNYKTLRNALKQILKIKRPESSLLDQPNDRSLYQKVLPAIVAVSKELYEQMNKDAEAEDVYSIDWDRFARRLDELSMQYTQILRAEDTSASLLKHLVTAHMYSAIINVQCLIQPQQAEPLRSVAVQAI